MNCPKCGKVMEMRVSIEIVLPSTYVNLICKKTIRSKECRITSVNWEKARAICYDCNYREVGL
jgi:hypothetical protein